MRETTNQLRREHDSTNEVSMSMVQSYVELTGMQKWDYPSARSGGKWT